ncbi:MAG: DUF5906 domain-containing protein [Ignavibacteriaceae bacterium]
MNNTRKDSIDLSLKDKNIKGELNANFKEIKAVNYTDLENTLKTCNYSTIQWKENNRKEDNFISASGFVIDIDDGMTIEEAKNVLTTHNLNYALITSKSHSDGLHKFHILLPFSRKIYTVENYKAVVERIKLELFPALDSSTMDAARFMYGSPDSATFLDHFNGKSFRVDIDKQVSAAWDDDFEVTLSDSSIVIAAEQKIEKKQTIPIFCPFHNDTTSSAFLAYSEDSFNHYIHCKACGKTYWKVLTTDIVALKSENFWSYGTSVYEAGITADMFSLENIGDKKFYIKVGAIKKEQKEVYISHLVKNKHLHRLNRIDSIGDVLVNKTTFEVNVNEGNIQVHVKALPVNIQDNAFIDSYLKNVFGGDVKFIKEWMAMLVYTNYAKLPTIILTGERGVGKNTFAETVAAIFPALSETAKDLDGNFNPFAEKKLLIIDEAASNGKVQYQMLKKFSGQKMLEVNKKYIPQYQVQNNLNIIFLSNDELPIYVERDEIPTDDRNNQFFVYRIKPHNSFDADLQQKLIDRMGHYIRTELKTVFENLNTSGYRYSIAVPITDDEKNLFNSSITDIEAEVDRVVNYVESVIGDVNWSGYKFVKAGLFPTRIFDDIIQNPRVNKIKVIQNLQKHGYIDKNKAAKYQQIDGERPYSYKLGHVWLEMVNNQPSSKVPVQMLPDRHTNGHIDLLTGTEG